MNKKEIAEIKKQFTPDRCAITRICGCYVELRAVMKKNGCPLVKPMWTRVQEENVAY